MINPTTNNELNTTVKELDYSSTSGSTIPSRDSRDLGFRIIKTQIKLNQTPLSGFTQKTIITPADNDPEEISKKDKDKFYKITLSSKLL